MVDLASARNARRARDGVKNVGRFTDRFDQRRLPAPDGAETTNRMPERENWLLKVLNLFANLFQLCFAGDDALRNHGIVCLCAQCVEFAKNFLGDEF